MRTMEPNTERKSRVRYPRGDCKLSNRISCISWRTLWDAFYVGHTGDLARRVGEHNDPLAPGVKFAPKNGPWRLVWSEEHPNRALAMIRERQIKAMKSARWIRRELLGSTSS